MTWISEIEQFFTQSFKCTLPQYLKNNGFSFHRKKIFDAINMLAENNYYFENSEIKFDHRMYRQAKANVDYDKNMLLLKNPQFWPNHYEILTQ